MNVKYNLLLSFVLFINICSTQTEIDSIKKTNPINSESYLHPMDNISPYTLKKGEWIYAQSIQTLPFPSWMFVGVTDKLTAQIDLLPWVFGAFSDLKKPIPSLNFRYRFNDQNGSKPTFAVETMFVYFWEGLDRFSTDNVSVRESGAYFHFKPVIGYQFDNHFDISLSAGIDYMSGLTVTNVKTLETKIFNNRWTPNASISLGYRPSNWISYHAGFSSGATLTYLENVPNKQQLTYGVRIAPFYKVKAGFLRTFRVEFTAINAWFPDVNAKELFPIPVFPYLYWQWHKK